MIKLDCEDIEEREYRSWKTSVLYLNKPSPNDILNDPNIGNKSYENNLNLGEIFILEN